MPPLTQNKPLAPEDIIREDSGPPITERKEPQEGEKKDGEKRDGEKKIDVDDAMIEEPKDDVFDKDAPQDKKRRRG
jgi:hypothetical protein